MQPRNSKNYLFSTSTFFVLGGVEAGSPSVARAGLELTAISLSA